jgi:hypothetical protein
MRRWKRTLPTAAAALLAAYFGARLAARDDGGLALAAGGGAEDRASGLTAVITGGRDRYGNRLVVVDTRTKHLMVYRIKSGQFRLVSARDYTADLEWGETPDPRGSGFSYEEATKAAEQVRKLRAKAGLPKWRAAGRELVVTADSDDQEGRNRIVLVNPDLRTILVYRMADGTLWLEAARPFDADLELLSTPAGASYTAVEVRRMVEEVQKRGGAGRTAGK